MPKCDRNVAAWHISSEPPYGAHCTAMRVCYDIQTHRDPDQISRLVRTLLTESPGAVVHISHDRRGPALDERALQAYGDVVVELADGGYGDFSHVERHMQAIAWVLDHRPDVDWLVNLTGQDYPIVPIADDRAGTRIVRGGRVPGVPSGIRRGLSVAGPPGAFPLLLPAPPDPIPDTKMAQPVTSVTGVKLRATSCALSRRLRRDGRLAYPVAVLRNVRGLWRFGVHVAPAPGFGVFAGFLH